ncbi:hypothetical protein ILYODFUR_032675 [Ilyodon furcidens]|uniref:Uncharacterized protein n=1 Tax=Ilyodon furcidens TaxID=33524 RepID=A0ABV0TQJ3_9TELE
MTEIKCWEYLIGKKRLASSCYRTQSSGSKSYLPRRACRNQDSDLVLVPTHKKLGLPAQVFDTDGDLLFLMRAKLLPTNVLTMENVGKTEHLSFKNQASCIFFNLIESRTASILAPPKSAFN